MEHATRGPSRSEKRVVLHYLEEVTMQEIGLVLDYSESGACRITAASFCACSASWQQPAKTRWPKRPAAVAAQFQQPRV